MDWWPDLAYRISGVWAFGPKLQFQLWWASQEKMCPSGTSQSQLVDPGQRGKMELVPSSCWNYVYSKDLFSPFHSSQHRLLCFYHHSVRQRNKYKWTFEFKSFLVGSRMASPIVHNWTLLFLLLVQDVCFEKKSEILWSLSYSSVAWALLGYLRLKPSVLFADGKTWKAK
jgi:hypothetical protein